MVVAAAALAGLAVMAALSGAIYLVAMNLYSQSWWDTPLWHRWAGLGVLLAAYFGALSLSLRTIDALIASHSRRRRIGVL